MDVLASPLKGAPSDLRPQIAHLPQGHAALPRRVALRKPRLAVGLRRANVAVDLLSVGWSTHSSRFFRAWSDGDGKTGVPSHTLKSRDELGGSGPVELMAGDPRTEFDDRAAGDCCCRPPCRILGRHANDHGSRELSGRHDRVTAGDTTIARRDAFKSCHARRAS
jgi:hypothetical protein